MKLYRATAVARNRVSREVALQVFLPLVLLLWVGAAAVAEAPAEINANNDPSKWINRMHIAVENANYQGTLVRMRGANAENFRIYHRVVNGDISERLVGMDGDSYESIRQGDETVCIFPDKRTVVVEKLNGNLKSPIAAGIPAYDDVMELSYTFAVTGGERVAGRECMKLNIEAVDEYRYGYRIWIDRRTGMPLKSQLRSADGAMMIEEVMFSDIAFVDEVPQELVKTGYDTSGWKRVTHDDSQQERFAEMPGWKASELPPGFELKTVRHEFMMGEEEPRLHLVYMDGLASVSVFIEKHDTAGDEAAESSDESAEAMGSTHAFTVLRDGWMVTAVGQVPAATVGLIAASMVQE